MKFEKSQEWLERAKKVIPYPYTQTFSKGPAMYVQGQSPIFASHGAGCYLYDVDNNRYIDMVMGLMPLILGYVDILKENGMPLFSLPTRYEVELSELLCELIPCAEMVRFGKNGSDTTTAAVRLARAITGRDYILACGYHGWHDWYIGKTGRNKGVPEDTKRMTKFFEYNDLCMLRQYEYLRGNVACIIMEPMHFEMPKPGFLEGIREYCTKNKVPLIFDEIITGFRFGLGGAQEFLGITPDIACFGKAMANGWPISAVVGRKELMEEFGNVHFSITFGGEVNSIRAALKTIEYLRKNEVIQFIRTRGSLLKLGVHTLIDKHGLSEWLQIEGTEYWSRFRFKDYGIQSLFSQECIKRGLLILDSHNLSYSHTDSVIQTTLDIYNEVFEIVGEAIRTGTVEKVIKGIPIQQKTVRGK